MLGFFVVLALVVYLLQYFLFQPQPGSQDDLVQLSQQVALEPVRVTLVEPEDGQYFTAKTPIVIHFDQPMVFDADQPILTIEPALEGRYGMRDEETFDFLPLNPIPGQAYHFELPATLMAKNGAQLPQSKRWTLYAAPEGLASTDPLLEETIAPDQPITIQFSQAVDLSAVQPAKNVQLYPSNDADGTAGDGFFNTEVRYGHDGQGKERSDTLVFTPSFPFQSGQTYRLIVRAGEAFPLREDFVLTFNVK